MSILDKILGQGSSPSLDSVKFDASRYDYQGDQDGTRVWFLPEGGGVGLYLFRQPPDLPVNLATVGELRDSYASRLRGQMNVVDCRVLALDGMQGVWLIVRALSKESQGATYIGSLTIPFRNFSFVIKIQCQEQGVTGMREAVLVDDAPSKGTVAIENERMVFDGWSPDDEQFDSKFPQHPLSRMRAELRHLAASVRIASTIKSEPRFELPQNGD